MAVGPEFDAAVIGAGAAGLFCALTAAKRGRRVLLLEHTAAPGAKILISGGGRCNFTNLNIAPENFVSTNPHFCKSALAGFTPQDFTAMVTAHGIAYHEKTLGQLFCNGSAKQILNMLMQNCNASDVDLRVAHSISGISKPDVFHIQTSHGPFTASSLVLATGGLSIPKMGATGFAYDIAKQFGLPLTEIRPGLVPLIVAGEQWGWMQGLSGVSFDSIAARGKTSFWENSLFTHRGLSGPAILQISSYWREGQSITLNMLPGQDAYAYLKDRKSARPKAELKTILNEILPARLAHNLLQPPIERDRFRLTETAVGLKRESPSKNLTGGRFTIEGEPRSGSPSIDLAPGNHIIGDMPDKALKNTADKINGFSITPSGTEGYAKAEVTLGGVDTNALSSKTMEARNIPGLYVIGEAVDVTGWLGGYNFQWAWSSAQAAGTAV